MDDGEGGEFAALLGNESQGDSLATRHTIAYGLREGVLYRFRYRARNVNGWSALSPIAYIRAATVPARPPAPTRDSVDATSIAVTIQKAQGDGGSNILGYELYINQGTGTTSFLQVTAYSGDTSSHTLTVADDSLIAGQTYLLMTRAQNEFGFGEYSEQLSVGLADFPDPPATLVKVDADSGPTYITLEWSASAATELPVLGYRLLMMDNALGTDVFEEVYNGLHYPNVLKYTVSSEVVGSRAYTF